MKKMNFELDEMYFEVTITNIYEEILKAYQEYCYYEFDDNETKEMQKVYGVAFTTLGDNEEYAIQLDYNTEKQEYLYYVDCELKKTESIPLKTFLEDLKNATFEDFIRDFYDIIEEMNPNAFD